MLEKGIENNLRNGTGNLGWSQMVEDIGYHPLKFVFYFVRRVWLEEQPPPQGDLLACQCMTSRNLYHMWSDCFDLALTSPQPHLLKLVPSFSLLSSHTVLVPPFLTTLLPLDRCPLLRMFFYILHPQLPSHQ